MENTCRFINKQIKNGDITILHFVLENKKQVFNEWKTLTSYRVHVVNSGYGVLHTSSSEYQLKKGDVFIVSPAVPYALESVTDFSYYYISYVGLRANAVMDNFKIFGNVTVFKNYEDLLSLYSSAITMPDEALSLSAEGVLLYTFARLLADTTPKDSSEKNQTAITVVKKYVDENFTNPTLTLRSACKKVAYNANYISVIFKKELGVSFKEYLNMARIQNACRLMEKGFKSVNDIAFLCGFNDPLYFSKVFKSKMEVTPTAFIKEVQLKSGE